MRTLLAVAFLSLLAACATTLRARSDYDRSQDFTRYHTFAWMAADPMVTPAGQINHVSALNRRRIVEAIQAELRKKGFEKVQDAGAADFVVSYTVGSRDRIDARSYPTAFGGPWHWGWHYYGSEVNVATYREGTLAIDVFDGTTRQPVWHGWASKRITEEDVEHAAERIQEGVAAILKGFPPA